jgi:hypothetical protein
VRKPLLALLALLAAAPLSLGICACGGAGTESTSASNVTSTTAATTTSTSESAFAPTATKADSDKDDDVGAPYDDKSNDAVLNVGHAASAGDRHKIVALIQSYYKAALRGDGAKACTMIYSTLAESVPEDYGTSPPGPPYMRGTTCPAVLTLLFRHYHSQLALELPKLKVTRVRLEEHHGLAVLRSGTMPERQIPVAREGHVWKLSALLDSQLP